MPRSTVIFIAILFVLAGLLGFNYFYQPFAYLGANNQAVMDEADLSASKSAEFLAKKAELDQLGQLLAVPLNLDEDQVEEMSQWAVENQAGMVTFFGSEISTTSAQAVIKNLDSFTQKIDAKQAAPLIAVDHEGGDAQRLSGEGFTILPSWRELCRLPTSQRDEFLSNSAKELSDLGVNMIFAPVLDVASQSAQPVLGDRLCSSQEGTVSLRAQEMIDIFSQNQILPVVKHFPGIGALEVDLHKKFGQVKPDQASLDVFKEILSLYPKLGVMTTHVGVEGMYPDEPCSLNPECVGDVSTFFPETLIFSDALEMVSAGKIAPIASDSASATASSAASLSDSENQTLLSLPQRAVSALKAGNNVLVFGPDVNKADLEAVLIEIRAAYQTDDEFKTQVDQSLEKLREYQQLFLKAE